MKVSDMLKNKPIHPSVLIYGPLGTGKSAFLGQAGEGSVYIDFDRGYRTLETMKDKWTNDRLQTDVHSFYEDNPNSPTQLPLLRTFLLNLVNKAKRKKDPIIPRSVEVDSFTGLARTVQMSILANSGHQECNPTQPEWGTILNTIESLVTIIHSIPTIKVFAAHDFPVEQNDTIRWELLCPGRKLPSYIKGFFDDVFYAKIKKAAGGKRIYSLTSTASPAVACRTRSSFKADWDMDDGFWKLMEKLGYKKSQDDSPTKVHTSELDKTILKARAENATQVQAVSGLPTP